MSQQIINIGALPNDGQGDPLRVAYSKINENFTELYENIVMLEQVVGSNYIVTLNDHVVTIDPSGVNRVVTLPDDAPVGKIYTIKKVNNSPTTQVTITTSDVLCTIDGAATYILNNMESITVVMGNNGVNNVYYVIGKVV